jgi:lysophospholipase L1-like esterase
MRFLAVFIFLCAALLGVVCLRGQSPISPPSAGLPTLYIVGDSTANIHGDGEVSTQNRVGWGTPFPRYFDENKVRVVNAASAGRSSRTFINEGKWEAVTEQLRAGDFVLIQFGHNDPAEVDTGKARGSLPGVGDDTKDITDREGKREIVHTFGWYLRKYVQDTRSKGATPILLSVTPRNIWTDGKPEVGLGHFREWAAQVAPEEDVDYVDVSGIVSREYAKLGPEKVAAFFPLDHTHTNEAGAELNARCVVAGLKSLPDSPLTAYLSPLGDAILSSVEASLPVPANPKLPTLWLIGDSTVRNGQGDGANGQWGWGDEIAPYFKTDHLNVVNRAVGGRSSRTYYEFHWPAVLRMMKRGDAVLMQFGHNDSSPLDDKARARGTLPGDGDETKTIDNPITRKREVVHTFGWYEQRMIEEARQKGAKPVVLSLVPRKIWDGGNIHREEYADWAKEAAKKEHVAFVDLNAIVARRYEAMGVAAVDGLFGDPHTHTNLAGAKLNAQSVVEGLKALPHDPLKKYFLKEPTIVTP